MASSTYNLLAITSERYMMVVYPLYHKSHITQRKLYIVIGLVWLIGPLYRVSFVTPSRTLGNNQKCITVWPSDEWGTTFGVMTPIFEFFLPAIVMTFMYGRMIVTLQTKVAPVVPSAAQQNLNRYQRNLLKTLMIVAVVFVSCWSINEITYFLDNMGLHIEMRPTLINISISLVYANCSVNPLIYLLKYREFRAGVRHLLGCGRDNSESSSNS